MFVKIIRNDGVAVGDHESLYDCRKVDIHPINKDSFYVTMEGADATITVEIDKREDIAVYVMNNQGKTIDTIFSSRWQHANG